MPRGATTEKRESEREQCNIRCRRTSICSTDSSSIRWKCCHWHLSAPAMANLQIGGVNNNPPSLRGSIPDDAASQSNLYQALMLLVYHEEKRTKCSPGPGQKCKMWTTLGFREARSEKLENEKLDFEAGSFVLELLSF